jgi:hypothetical protein
LKKLRKDKLFAEDRSDYDDYLEIETDRFSLYLLAKIKKIVREEIEAALEEDKVSKKQSERQSDYERWRKAQLQRRQKSPNLSPTQTKKR